MFSMAELKSVREFRACLCVVGVTWSKKRQTTKSNVVSSDRFRVFEKLGTTKVLVELPFFCAILLPSIESRVVVSLRCENGQFFCATAYLSLSSIVASPFVSGFSLS